MPKKILLDSKKIQIILTRLVCELIENHKDFKNTILIGLQPRGVLLYKEILKVIKKNHPKIDITSGILDFTFFRDDFRRSKKTLSANSTEIDFSIENQKIILIDDVLYTGRSIKSAMSAIDSYGRPKSIELLVLIDRRFKREIPIEPTYYGAKIDTFKGDKVRVIWDDKPINNKVFIES